MNRIKKPEFKIIRTNPSSLGTIDFYIVLYEKIDSEIREEVNECEIAEEIYETGAFKGFYVVHSSTTRGEDISSLENGKKHFVFNRINCDSILTYHCLAIKENHNLINLRTGFHESYDKLPNTINSWVSMDEISNGYQEIEIDKDEFYELYNQKLDEWKKQITKQIIYS